MPHVLFTGGGTAGHVTPNVALIEAVKAKGWSASYVGSKDGIENEIISRVDVPFTSISSGKLRRYFSWENFIDPFRVLIGVIQSIGICLREKPDVVFSKGGFVSVPIVIAAWCCRVPVISHESDVTPGLANRITYPFCKKICVTFDETARHLPGHKVVAAGTPVRKTLLEGLKERGLAAFGFSGEKPLLLAFGGSLGAQVINDQLIAAAEELSRDFDIVHIVGEGNLTEDSDGDIQNGDIQNGYIQKEYLHEEFGDVLAAAEVVVSRAGANSLYELLITRKPHLLIPLSRAASRGDQLVNAETFERLGFSKVLYEEELDADRFVRAVRELHEHKDVMVHKLEGFERRDSVAIILEELEKAVNNND